MITINLSDADYTPVNVAALEARMVDQSHEYRGAEIEIVNSEEGTHISGSINEIDGAVLLADVYNILENASNTTSDLDDAS